MSANDLLSGASAGADGASTPWFGGEATVLADGTFGGSTVHVQLARPGTTGWQAIIRDGSTNHLAMSTAGANATLFGNFTAYGRWDVRASVAGGTTSTSVNVRIGGRGLLGST